MNTSIQLKMADALLSVLEEYKDIDLLREDLKHFVITKIDSQNVTIIVNRLVKACSPDWIDHIY